MQLMLIIALLVTCRESAFGLPAPSPAAFSPPAVIDITSLKPFLDTLPPDEKAEQLRDWALYGARNVLGLTSPEEMPIRHPALKESHPGEVSLGRVFPLSAKEWGVVVAPELIADKPLLGGLVDRNNATCNCLPETISLFTYATNPTMTTLSIAFAGSLKAKEMYTPEYGYHSATVSTLADFNNFITTVDDVISLQWQAGSVSIGGRKYAQDGRRALTLEDIAGLYQAFHVPAAAGKSAEVDIGFSLDPKLNYRALGDDLTALERVPGVEMAAVDPAFAALLSRHRAELMSIGTGLKKQHDLRPFQALQSRYEGAQTPAEVRFRSLLRFLVERNSYQTARYDGKLQGTSVGMILFYTDLLAKLWLLDFDGAAPKAVVGFRNIREIKLPKLYWEDFVHRPATRLWFGLRQEGFDFYDNKILFQPVVSRVYAASYDPASPGKESRPNYNNREFLGWWDTHYEAMATAESYYHKLDQIQKWSTLFMVLEESQSHVLDFLMKFPVRHSIDFEIWNKREAMDSKIKISFLDRHQCGAATECLPLLASDSFPVMGTTYMLSGGVSLASRKDILAKMHKHGPQGSKASAPVAEGYLAKAGASSAAGSGYRSPAGTKTPVASAPSRTPGYNPAKRTVSAATAPTSAPRPGAAPVSGQVARGVDRSLGTFSAEKVTGAIRLGWTMGPALAPYELVASLAALQEAKDRRTEGERIFSGVADIKAVVRVKEGNLYLVKTSTSRDEWIYLAVNPAKIDEYPAKAAAAFLEADIYGAKLVPGDFARKLSADKPVVM